MKMAGKLSKLKMPKREEISMEELDMGPAPELAGEAEGEGEGEMGMEPEMPEQEPGMLADVSDDDLLAEVKKRGLMGQLDMGEGEVEEGEEEEDYMA